MHRNSFALAAKRGLDVAASACGLVLLSPVMAAIALAILVRMGKPVLFLDRRPGKDERTFTLYKFRTMREASAADGTALPDGERLTPLGRWLRRSSLDELPQLWNVLSGDMSLVGPRPLRLEYLPYFRDREHLRHSVRPGITGWAQIHGRNESTWDERFERDVWYVENWTLRLDLKILARTFLLVLQRRGVLEDAQSRGMQNLDHERAGLDSTGGRR